MRHIMSPLDFSVEELDQMMDLAADIEKTSGKIRTCLRRQENCHTVLRAKYQNPSQL